MAINKLWHEKHRMPKNATTAQRITWHLAHAKACACRPIPLALQKIIAKK
ncbi:MAG: hypothetical protein ABI758_00225 [Candidatus Woesebacteria bacterium]